MVWWIDLGYPPFEEGKGGFPRTGQVIKYYREHKRDAEGHVWTQSRLAQELEISGKTVGEIENRDASLDFDRRQRLSELFAIPPILLGIRTREEILKMVEEHRAKEATLVVSPSVPPSTWWWVELNYPPFAPGKDGFFPRTGQVIKHYRRLKMDTKGKPWTQRGLAQALGITTDQAVWDLENKDTTLDFERRQFLSKLFAIPPVLLGIRTREEILKMVEQKRVAKAMLPIISNAPATSRKLLIDVEEYSALLASYWTTFISDPARSPMTNVLLSLDTLYRELPHVRDKKPIQELLCRFHDFVANVLCDRQMFDDALVHLDKASRFATLLNKDELKALTLYDYGYALWLTDRFDEALRKCEEARYYEWGLPGNLRGSLLLETGSTGAHAAKTPEKRKEAIALVDLAGNIVRRNQKEEDPYFLKFDLDRYHLIRSSSLIAVGWNRDAIDELKLVKAGPESPRRQAYKDIFQAQAHANLGEYSEAACLAASGLLVVQGIKSEVNIARVVKLYRQLQKSSFKNDPEVARLDYLLSRR